MREGVEPSEASFSRRFLREAGPPVWGMMCLSLEGTSFTSCRNEPINLVPEAGLEPAHHLWRRILSPVRLPIPPLRLAGESI